MKMPGFAIALCGIISLNLLLPMQPAQGAICRSLGEKQVCVVEIQRSAKYYWQYRVILTVDGQKRPREIYNCRDRLRISAQGDRIPFQPQGIGSLICRLTRR
ncbi:MAG: hypothetical protein SAJ12_24210 [Jaaginema sp. PMC 1079.18]|nr:hypothetical protein [Jaaginema sp. PMC 1080.18]MEC4854098.1 hypothetical protein [Jaaginema sp. PMC 1079.18]MEC4868121.1 hypothetical protein [Jaaginema sp. PMC 1078.18]